MYNYRKLTQQEKEEVLTYRRLLGLPLHEPPHYLRENNLYLLTAANYEHRWIMQNEERRVEFTWKLLQWMTEYCQAHIYAFCILPNHYHVLSRVDLNLFRQWIGKLNNGTSTQWNREDNRRGRRVWYRFSDRGIRNEDHFYATLNYIHYNPVKHKHATYIDEWRCSSIHAYLEQYGHETMIELAERYPLYHYGDNWDK